MSKEVEQGNGYIFIDHDGKYAKVGSFQSCGGSHAPIHKVDRQNEATVFESANPWDHYHAKYLSPLKSMQRLKARVERVVKLVAWREDSK